MYRARVGMDLIPNRYIHDKAVEWHRKVHKQNMDVIKKRKAGTGTLDNNCPDSAVASRGWRVNGRPKFIKEDRYKTIQRQNKVLLQRMTKVMTTGTDLFEYGDKLPPRSLNSVARKQRMMHISKRNKRLVHILETIKPYYSAEKWEEDRAKQEGVLKWMAKVHYKPVKESMQTFRDRELKKLTKEMEEGVEEGQDSLALEAPLQQRAPPTSAPGTSSSSPHLRGAITSRKKLKSAGGGEEQQQGEGHHEGKGRASTSTSLPPPTGAGSVSRSSGSRQQQQQQQERGTPASQQEAGSAEARRGGPRAGNLHRIKEAQQAAAAAAAAAAVATSSSSSSTPALSAHSASSSPCNIEQQVQAMFETLDKARNDLDNTTTLRSAPVLTKAPSYAKQHSRKGLAEDLVSQMTRSVVIKRSNGDEPVVKVNVTYSCLTDETGLRVQVKSFDGEEMSFSTESTLAIDDARTILSLNQKKKGPLSKAELISLVTGLMENFELIETAGTISIIFRRRLEFSNEDQFFSMVNKNLTALQQLYLEQREEVRRASIDFVGSESGTGRVQALVRETLTVPIQDPSFHPATSDPSKRLPVSDVQVHFIVRDPVCGEVLITARVLPNAATGDNLVLTLQSRVPTLALANRSAAVEYVGKVISRLAIVKTEGTAPGWKLDIVTE